MSYTSETYYNNAFDYGFKESSAKTTTISQSDGGSFVMESAARAVSAATASVDSSSSGSVGTFGVDSIGGSFGYGDMSPVNFTGNWNGSATNPTAIYGPLPPPNFIAPNTDNSSIQQGFSIATSISFGGPGYSGPSTGYTTAAGFQWNSSMSSYTLQGRVDQATTGAEVQVFSLGISIVNPNMITPDMQTLRINFPGTYWALELFFNDKSKFAGFGIGAGIGAGMSLTTTQRRNMGPEMPIWYIQK